jgi:glycosyltransferase involved in cell wall biosynthesis
MEPDDSGTGMHENTSPLPPNSSNSVSVIMPAYNGARYIAQTLDSILAQTVPAFEIVVVNDGSTDETASIVETYGDRVTLVNVKNGGAQAARNLAASMATGTWIAPCDADDIWLPEKLEKQLRLANECSEVHCVLTDYTAITDDVLSPRSHFSYAPPDFWKAEQHVSGFVIREPITAKLSVFQPAITSTPLVKRDFFLEVGGFDVNAKNSAEDTCFHFRCLSVVPFGVVPEVLMHYRRHADSWSADGLKQLRNTIVTWQYIISTYGQAQRYRDQLLKGVDMMREEVAEMTRYRRRQQLKRLLGFR